MIAGEWLTENELELVSSSSLLCECCVRLLFWTIWYLGL